MKRKIHIIALVIMAIMGCLTSCKEKLNHVDGVVTEVEASQLMDTLKSMKLYDGEDTLLFGLQDAEYNNGIMVKGDSVQVHYIKGHGDTLRALLVYVKPRASKVIDLKVDTTQVLLTK